MPRLQKAHGTHPPAWRLLPEHLTRVLPHGVSLPTEYEYWVVNSDQAQATETAAKVGATVPTAAASGWHNDYLPDQEIRRGYRKDSKLPDASDTNHVFVESIEDATQSWFLSNPKMPP